MVDNIKINKKLISDNASSSEKNSTYFIDYNDGYCKIKPLFTMFLKTSIYGKSYEFFMGDNESFKNTKSEIKSLLKMYLRTNYPAMKICKNLKWNSLKTKSKPDSYDNEIPKVGSHYIFFINVLIDSVLKKLENCYLK